MVESIMGWRKYIVIHNLSTSKKAEAIVGEKVRLEIVKVGGVVEELGSLRYSLAQVDNACSTISLLISRLSM